MLLGELRRADDRDALRNVPQVLLALLRRHYDFRETGIAFVRVASSHHHARKYQHRHPQEWDQ
jgi:hypothetical protein